MLVKLKCDSNSPFLPSMEIPIFVNLLDKERTRTLYNFILQKEKWILDNTEIYPEGDDPSWLTNRLYSYNLFNFADECPAINDLKNFVQESYLGYCSSVGVAPEKVYVQCWANILRNNGRHITEHDHADGHADSPVDYAYVSGTICLNNANTNTSFRNPFATKLYHDIKNHAGENILFPSWVTHKTDANLTPLPRVSIAYDIITQKQYELAQIEQRKNNFVPLYG